MRPLLFKKEDLYNKELLQVSHETEVPLSVLKGFFALESAFNVSAKRYEKHRDDSSYGLSQVLYKTAKGFGYKGEPEGLMDAYTSAYYGAKFIKQLSKKHKNILDIIASYNMGWPRKIEQTTKFIAKIYSYPYSYKTNPPARWVYANQPYVDRVASYIAYYQALEKNDIPKAWDIYKLIKKKSYGSAMKYIVNPFGIYGLANQFLQNKTLVYSTMGLVAGLFLLKRY